MKNIFKYFVCLALVTHAVVHAEPSVQGQELKKRQQEFLERVKAYNPIQTRLDLLMWQYIKSTSTSSDIKADTGIPVLKGVSFDQLVEKLSKSFSPVVSKSRGMQFTWRGTDDSGVDFGSYADKNGTRFANASELETSIKTLTISPAYDQRRLNTEDLSGYRYLSLRVSVGREFDAKGKKEIGALSFALDLIEHPLTKEVIVVTDDMGLGCDNCEANQPIAIAMTDNELSVEVRTSFWEKAAKFEGKTRIDAKKKFVVSFNESLDTRLYSTEMQDIANAGGAYSEIFYATGGSAAATLLK